MAKRPPSSCTIGRSSGGITGTASRIMSSGRLSELMKAETTFSRLTARDCFWPLAVLTWSSSSSRSASRSTCWSRSRTDSAPMPPRKYSPQPNGDPKRSFSSRNSVSSAITCLGSIDWNSSQTCRMRSEASSM